MKMKTLSTTTKEFGTTLSYSYSFRTKKTAQEIFNLLLNIPAWWSGIFEETIAGPSKQVGDEFEFKAGGGAHYTKQKLIELVPDKRIIWEIRECHLQFVTNHSEWVGTHLQFDIESFVDDTKVTFTHLGLVPQFECFEGCSGAWTQYMEALENNLNT
ncbi:SRPBCC family protein [Flagellimonas sediminis]|uniref:SRPBCC domain-containing protein n=1 Tax=Flagellimonas sediminis TaxID=2696468 RepID=A0A6I5L3V0_9FLAO|nr:SRPBCC domain-containing protein [Allomuricauda sediminis]NDV45152.1 SRPBCC domain-containing protein [Allomuricauda sediminis]